MDDGSMRVFGAARCNLGDCFMIIETVVSTAWGKLYCSLYQSTARCDQSTAEKIKVPLLFVKVPLVLSDYLERTACFIRYRGDDYNSTSGEALAYLVLSLSTRGRLLGIIFELIRQNKNETKGLKCKRRILQKMEDFEDLLKEGNKINIDDLLKKIKIKLLMLLNSINC
ncbi:hypothetical protein Tco_1007372 [Tanacetum coccineum]